MESSNHLVEKGNFIYPIDYDKEKKEWLKKITCSFCKTHGSLEIVSSTLILDHGYEYEIANAQCYICLFNNKLTFFNPNSDFNRNHPEFAEYREVILRLNEENKYRKLNDQENLIVT